MTRLLYEDWDDKKATAYMKSAKIDSRNSIKGSKEWFEALEKFCLDYEEKSIPRDEVYMEKNQAICLWERC